MVSTQKTTVIKTTTETSRQTGNQSTEKTSGPNGSLQSPKPKGDNLQPEQLEAGDNKTAEMTSEQTGKFPSTTRITRKIRLFKP